MAPLPLSIPCHLTTSNERDDDGGNHSSGDGDLLEAHAHSKPETNGDLTLRMTNGHPQSEEHDLVSEEIMGTEN